MRRNAVEKTASSVRGAHRPRADLQADWSSFAFSADLTVRFQTGLPALAAPLADLCSSLAATKVLSRTISNTNLFSARLTTSRAMDSSSIFTLLTVTRSVCSLLVLQFSCFSALSQQ